MSNIMLVLDEDNSLVLDEDNAPDMFDIDHTALDIHVNDHNGIKDPQTKNEKHSNKIIKSKDANDINITHTIPSDKKACSRCTFHNDLSAKKCEMCESPFPTPGGFDKPPVPKIKSMKLNLNPQNIDQQESCMATDPRELLSKGDNVQIYSESGKKWCKGKVTRVHYESNGHEWLTIKYAKNTYYDSQKQIGRYSEYLQPMEVNTEAKIDMYDMQKKQSIHEFIQLFPSKTSLSNCKPNYFIEILSILEENVTIRLNVAHVSKHDRTFVIRDIDKDFELQRIIVEKNWNYGVCKLFIWDDVVGDEYHIAVYNRQNTKDMLSNDIRFTKYRNDEYPPPKPIDADSITQVVNKNEILLYWNIPNGIYGDNIEYEISFDDEKKDVEMVKTLPYSLKLSHSKNSETQVRIKTYVTVFEDGKHHKMESEYSPFIEIGNIQQVFNECILQFMNKYENDKADQEQRIQNLEQIKEERDKYFEKLNVVMDNILSQKNNKYDLDEELQCKIRDVYNNKYEMIFFKKFVKEISMLFFDAKAIHSAFITHRVPIKSKKLKTVNKVADCVELINNFVGVPFVTNVIKIYKAVAKYGYDKYVLKLSATNTNNFELKYCKYGGLNFAKQIGVNIIESNCIQHELKEIDDAKKDKEKKKEIEKIAHKYGEYLLLLITTGHADGIVSKLDFKHNEFIDIISVMVLMQKIKKKDLKFEDAWNKERVKDLTRRIGKNAKDLMVEGYYYFGTEQFLKNVINSAKQFFSNN